MISKKYNEQMENYLAKLAQAQTNICVAEKPISNADRSRSMTYNKLIKNLRKMQSHEYCVLVSIDGFPAMQIIKQAADAIEELQKDLERSKDFEAFWQHEAEEALKKFQVAISNKPKWIPVTERLPEDRKMVLATVDGVVRIAFYGNYMWEEVETYSIFYPTHWMPLPQSPEREE